MHAKFQGRNFLENTQLDDQEGEMNTPIICESGRQTVRMRGGWK
jgi:hypothetical protein